MAKFDNAKVGDRLWSLEWNCWGTITTINYNEEFPLFFITDNGDAFTSLDYDGKTQEDGLVVFYWNEVHLPTAEEDKKPFDLFKFLKENLITKEYSMYGDNYYIYYDYESGNYYVYNENDKCETFGLIYFEKENIIKVVNTLQENKITPHQLKEAFKKLGWL